MGEYLKTDVSKPVEFTSGGRFISNEPWKHMKRNIDDLYVAIININNVLYIEQNGIQYEINPGDVFFLLPKQLHFGYKNSDIGTSYYWFHFYFPSPVELLDEEKMDQQIMAIRSSSYTHTNRMNPSILLPVHSTPKHIERIQILCKQLLDVSNANYYNSYCVNYLATALLIELSEQTITNFNTSFEQSNKDKKLAMILEWIRVHALTNNISVHMIADEFNYNKDYLTRLFKHTVGMSVQEYIHTLKLTKAKELLTRTNESIKTIANTVGFYDEKYFTRLFKKYEKVTPSDFRKAYYRMPMNNE
ncbi:AraC family transcriptional regulator [Halalkalibacter urbisdiaboli]|uniref:AraC family transcriptional regulator n=1 Tax=Halalkalibacter urbisdiaboli TaxID=1960589 RepID=UPI000B4532E2|nr:AraC family transcriptional regulator [Halalkalibacter urbisdiaboli]